MQRLDNDRGWQAAKNERESDEIETKRAERYHGPDRVQRLPQGFQEEEVFKCSQSVARLASHLPRVRRQIDFRVLSEDTYQEAQQRVHGVLRGLQ